LRVLSHLHFLHHAPSKILSNIISDLRMCEYYRYFKYPSSSKPLFGNLVPRINKGGVLYHLHSFFLNTDHSISSKRQDPQFASSTTSAKTGQEVPISSIQLMLGFATPTTKPVHEQSLLGLVIRNTSVPLTIQYFSTGYCVRRYIHCSYIND